MYWRPFKATVMFNGSVDNDIKGRHRLLGNREVIYNTQSYQKYHELKDGQNEDHCGSGWPTESTMTQSFWKSPSVSFSTSLRRFLPYSASAWWRHKLETLCDGKPAMRGGFPSQWACNAGVFKGFTNIIDIMVLYYVLRRYWVKLKGPYTKLTRGLKYKNNVTIHNVPASS